MEKKYFIPCEVPKKPFGDLLIRMENIAPTKTLDLCPVAICGHQDGSPGFGSLSLALIRTCA